MKRIILLLLLCFLPFSAGAAEFLVVVDNPIAYKGVAAMNQVAHMGASALSVNSKQVVRSTILEHLGMIIIETEDSDAASKLSQVDGVKAVSKARMVYAAAAQPNDPDFSKQWYHPSIGTLNAWDASQGDPDIVVAVCDTGVDYNHEDLKNSMWTGGSDYANGNKYGFSAFGSDPIDKNGHGTHVSGIIAATVNNSLGGIGLANVKIMAVKVLKDDGTAFNSDIAKGINYLIGQKRVGVNVRIANFSLGSGPTDFYDAADFAVYKALSASGILLLTAAGNDNNNNDNMPVYPSSYGLANQISVAATNEYKGGSSSAELAAWGSNYGKKGVDIFAPGTAIYSSLPTSKYSSGYGTWNGTSLAAPIAAGISALAWSVKPELKASDVKKIILESGTAASSLKDLCKTGMVVNAEKAVALAKTATPSPDDPKEPDDPIPPDPDNPDPSKPNINPIKDNKTNVGNGFSVRYDGNVLVYEPRIDGEKDVEHVLLYNYDLKDGYQILGGSYNHDRFGVTAEFRSGYYYVTVRFKSGTMLSDTTYNWSIPMIKDGMFFYLPIKVTRKADINIFGTDSGCSLVNWWGIILLAAPSVLLYGRNRKK